MEGTTGACRGLFPLPVDVPAITHPDQVNNAVLCVDLIDDAVVPVSERIAALLRSFQRFALVGISGEPIYETNELVDNGWVGTLKFLEVSICLRIDFDPEASVPSQLILYNDAPCRE